MRNLLRHVQRTNLSCAPVSGQFRNGRLVHHCVARTGEHEIAGDVEDARGLVELSARRRDDVATHSGP